MRLRPGLAAVAVLLTFATACSSSKKRASEPELSRYKGKKIALVELKAEKTARTIVEVALANQIAKRGTFVLLPKQDYDEARARIGVNTIDPNEVARAMGADYSLRIRLDQFEAKETKGFSKEEVDDSQLAAERGSGKASQVYPVKALEGKVRASLTFTDLTSGDVRAGDAVGMDRVEADAKTEAIHLPPKMKFLSDLTEKAFEEFFDRLE